MAAVIAQTRPSSNNGVGHLSWGRFLDSGSDGVSEAVVHEAGRRVKLFWADGHESEFSLKWLRDHSDGSFHVSTKQRKVDTFEIPNDTLVSHVSVDTMPPSPSTRADPNMDTNLMQQQVLRLRWDADGNTPGDWECTVPITRLRQHCNSETARTLRRQLGASNDAGNPDPAPVLWGKGVLSSAVGSSPLRFEYDAVMEDEDQPSSLTSPSPSSSSSSRSAASQLRGVLKSHGIALVRGVPTDLAGTETLGLKIAGHLVSTLRGKTLWGISTGAIDPDTAFRNLAYTTGALPLHTDRVFVSEPPGLQVFSCQERAPEGGASTYVDGFAVAERLRKENPEAFEFFTKTSFKYEYFDDGYHYVAEGPIFKTDSLGDVYQVRYSDIYRSPLDYLSADDIDRFYEHHKSLIAITRDPSMVEHILLESGDTMIFSNHRALHGRESYQGSRRMVGCYIGKDEAESEARMKGSHV